LKTNRLSSKSNIRFGCLLALLVPLSGCGKSGPTSRSGGGTTAGGGAGGLTTSAPGGTGSAGLSSGAGGTPPSSGGAPAGGDANGGSAGASPTTGASVLERNGGPTRESNWVQPTLTKAAAAKMALETGFDATFQGNMYASPLYIENGPGGKGAFIAVSADNVVSALDETTGAILWTKTLGASPGTKGQACGVSLDPVGILGTPVIDERSGTIYVAAAIGTDSVERHEVHALAVADGASRAGWPVNVSAMKAGSLSFNTKFQNQRSALSLMNGIVYVAYGGFSGDCDDYHGWIIAIDTADPSKTGAWATAGQGEAIWASGGFASDGTSIFPVTGNGTASSRDASNSESVLRISGLAEFQKSSQNEFYPSAWKSMDSADVDLGSSNSLLVHIPGASMPERVLVAIGKDAKIYLLNPSNLGGSDGHIAALQVANPTRPAATGVKTSPTAYTTANGTYVAFTVESAPDCPNDVTGRAVMGVKITGGSPPTATVAWCAPGPNPASAPISTSVDGKTDPVVWFVNDGQLKGVDGDSGESIFDGGSGSCSGVQRWTSPIAVKGRIVVGANGRLCSWKPSM
jgi:PQQ enzyme-like repeat protein